ncbi:MAG: transcription termination/antitermination NusG family protein [Prevotellaceae bacterium]|nr:transcription termination/antitermination NusG family protein [Prevotellaceae bacterium]
MWYIVQTETHKEQEAKEFLQTVDGVRDVYLPIYRKTIGGGWREGSNRVFVPTISGILFVNFQSKKKLEDSVTHWGYFMYDGEVIDERQQKLVRRKLFKPIHLLSFISENTDKEKIIQRAKVSTTDIERFRVYNDQLKDCIEDLKILDLNYNRLEAENDTVMITEGPYIGFEGVIKQVKHNGNKDRVLYFRIGNWCACIPGVRKYRHIIVREAVDGMKAQTVNAWRHVDHLIGRLQASGFPDDAPRQLRTILKSLNHDVVIEQYIASLKPDSPLYDFVSTMTPADAGCLISLSRYFQSSDRSINRGLLDLIPDVHLRPFLTPTSGIDIPEGKNHAFLEHDGFIELIVRVNLRPYFTVPLSQTYQKTERTKRGKEKLVTKEIPLADDEYIYYAHVGIYNNTDSEKVTAIVNWGGFYFDYIFMDTDERQTFLADLQAKGYDNLHALLSGTASTAVTLKTQSMTVGGFATEADCTETAILTAADILITACAPAAVEMWQGTRLLEWRRLIQQYVLLHKQRNISE